MKRSSGILLSITSLPSKYGIGCFSQSAYDFVDFLKASGQTYWQILPLGPTSYGDSPYQSFSTFAGNPYFIDLDQFPADDECDCINWGTCATQIDYEQIYNNRYAILQQAFARCNISQDEGFEQFCTTNADWLDDYALFMAIKEHFDGAAWNEWDEDIRLRKEEAVTRYRRELRTQILFQKFLQYHFYKQWSALKAYANENGIQIIGDIPIYVAFDSADTWSNPELFQLDEENLPTAVAGCPPDAFSADGQLWGNPLYRWDHHRSTGYQWWIRRIKQCFDLYDVVRIDHFRGFDEYYSIPFGDKTARGGHWEKGPGIELFRTIHEHLGEKDIIAEDLGFMTDSVRELVAESGFPYMKVLEFAFDTNDTASTNDYLPHNYNENCVAYTGTHDNQTVISWFQTIPEDLQKLIRNYLCDPYTPDDKLNYPLIGLLMRSSANLCIIPMQDWLGLDDSARMNTPSTLGNNWKWRMDKDALTDILAAAIHEITRLTRRI